MTREEWMRAQRPLRETPEKLRAAGRLILGARLERYHAEAEAARRARAKRAAERKAS